MPQKRRIKLSDDGNVKQELQKLYSHKGVGNLNISHIISD